MEFVPYFLLESLFQSIFTSLSSQEKSLQGLQGEMINIDCDFNVVDGFGEFHQIYEVFKKEASEGKYREECNHCWRKFVDNKNTVENTCVVILATHLEGKICIECEDARNEIIRKEND